MPLGSETYSVVDTALALTILLDEIMKAVRMPQDPLLRGRVLQKSSHTYTPLRYREK